MRVSADMKREMFYCIFAPTVVKGSVGCFPIGGLRELATENVVILGLGATIAFSPVVRQTAAKEEHSTPNGSFMN